MRAVEAVVKNTDQVLIDLFTSFIPTIAGSSCYSTSDLPLPSLDARSDVRYIVYLFTSDIGD